MVVFDAEAVDLLAQVLRLRRRVRILVAVVGLPLALVRVSGVRLDGRQLSEAARGAVLRAIERGRRVLPLRAVLRVLRTSPSSFHGWKTGGGRCHPADRATCPNRAPNQLTPEEISAMRDMATSPSYRHVPTSRLAVLAQRLGKVFASPTTWTRLVRQRGWRRSWARLHPTKPRIGLRTTRRDEAWHVDTTVIRLLDGTKAYVQAVIDNFSRRILAFRVTERFEIASTIAVLAEATRQALTATASGTVGSPRAAQVGSWRTGASRQRRSKASRRGIGRRRPASDSAASASQAPARPSERGCAGGARPVAHAAPGPRTPGTSSAP